MEAQKQQPIVNKARKTIFIVEDDQDLLDFYKMLLDVNGWNILGTINNGKDASKEYQKLKERPAVIILDIILPECSGLDVAKKILRINPNQKILFISGHIDHLSNDPVLKEFSSLKKPFTASSLFQKLSESISQMDPK